ncbi:MAG: hypothetical protein AAF074_03415 [Pseudomonadota bacterium]
MNKRQLLQRCCKIAGGSGVWETDDLSQFYHRFRPNGNGLEEVFVGVDHGNAIVSRIKAVMKMDGTDKGMALECRAPKPIDDARAIALAKKAVANVKQLATELDEEELSEMFKASEFELRSGQLSKYRQNSVTDERVSVMCDVVDDIMIGSDAAAAAMFEAAYTLAHDFPIAYYIQWPAVASEFKTEDPFKPFFDLWCHKIKWRFNKSNTVEVFTPADA